MASPRSVNLNIRARPREMKMWREAARISDETLSEYIRKCCNANSEQLLSRRSRKRGS